MAKSKYRKDFPERAEAYAREGMIDTEIAKCLGISERTFYEYQNKYPQFLQAIKAGKEPVDQGVEKALLKRAMGFDYEEKHVEYKTVPVVEGEPETAPKVKSVKIIKKMVAPDVAADIFWLKNRMPKKWRDKQDIEHSGGIETNGNIKIEIVKVNANGDPDPKAAGDVDLDKMIAIGKRNQKSE